MNFINRINSVKRHLGRSKLDAAIFVGKDNRIYLSGFAGSAGIFIVSRGRPVLLVDPRYFYRVEEEVKSARIECLLPGENHFEGLARIFKKNKWKKAGIDENEMTLKFFHTLKKHLKPARFETIGSFMEELRASKDKGEIKCIRGAAHIAQKALKELFNNIKAGMTEKEVQTDLIYYLCKFGSEGLAFEPIVASGRRGAHPHHTPSNKKIRTGETVIIDCGARFKGYCSDITRTIVLGKMTKEHKHVFDTLSRAKEAARKLLRDGVKCVDVDRAVRAVLKNSDVEQHFLHATGHGVGINVHEAPRISLKSKEVLKKGMVVTIEPGLYVKGWGGVRVEDMYLILKDGSVKLTSLTINN